MRIYLNVVNFLIIIFHHVALGNDSKFGFGWKCAQRRPLRALAHTLLLFDPEYVFLGDDDTYVNYPLLSQFVNKTLNPELHQDRVTYGSFCYANSITKLGFYYGGSGYIFGHRALSALISLEIIRDVHVNISMSEAQSQELSLYHTLLRLENESNLGGSYNHYFSLSERSFANSSTDNPSRPLLPLKPICSQNPLSLASDLRLNGSAIDCHAQKAAGIDHFTETKAQVTVRAIDLCVLLLSSEGTCHHSDHAITRCLAYGLGLRMKGIKCFCRPYEKIMRDLDPALTLTIAAAAPTLPTTPASYTLPNLPYKLIPYLMNHPQMCVGSHNVLCDVRVHLTCHRHRPLSLTDSRPVRFREHTPRKNNTA